MKYDFIEIGTSDFDTLLQKADSEIGISIDPISVYLNNLPDKDNVIKLNCAISDNDGIVDVYWISPDDIIKYNLPDWLRGCNSIINPHPSAIKELRDRDLEYVYLKSECRCFSWNTLTQLYDIKSVGYLKIDTEGHDCVIINGILDSGKSLPAKILFENNILSDQEYVEKTLNRLLKFGYLLKRKDFGPDSTILVEKHENR